MAKKGKSKSVKQQRLMGMAYAWAKGEMKDASPQVKFIAKSFLDSDKGKRKGLKNLKSFASTKHTGLPEKVKESFKIMRFGQLQESSNTNDVLEQLHGLNNTEINRLVDELVGSSNKSDRQDAVEEIMFTLDDINLSGQLYNEIHDKLNIYLQQQK